MLTFAIAIRDPKSHLLDVVLEIDRADFADPAACTLFLPTWTPGSYMVREYSRHLQGFAAEDAATGRELPWSKPSKNRFVVGPATKSTSKATNASQRIRVRYQVYAFDLTVRTADVTEDHAFWNGACVLLWPVERRTLRARVSVELPTDWDFTCPLLESGTAGVWRLREATLDELVDSPCLAGRLQHLPFDVRGVPHEYVIDGLGGLPLPESLVDDTRRILEHAVDVFGGDLPCPRYEFQTLLADGGRGGLEHRDCSVLLAPRTTFHPRKSYEDFLGLVAHEYFHLWNVKRLQPIELVDPDLEREVYTSLLWVAEGFTSYYDDLLCLRASVLTPERYLEIVAGHVNDVQRTPGRHLHPLVETSRDAWIKYYRPDENSRNSSQSYYVSGALAALLLDLAVRKATGGERCLDDVVRVLWQTTWKQGRGYTHADVVDALTTIAGVDLADTVHELVEQPFRPDFAAAFADFGVLLETQAETTPALGLQWRADGSTVAAVLTGSPAAASGIAAGDEILAFDGNRVNGKNAHSLYEVLAKNRRRIEVLLARRGLVLARTIELPDLGTGDVRLVFDPRPSPAAERLRAGWLRVAPKPAAPV